MLYLDITTTYDLKDATLEIVIMLLVAFILGYLFRYFLKPVTKITEHTDESLNLLNQLNTTQNELEHCIQEKSNIKKNLTLEYSNQIEDLKSKLSEARHDLEKSLALKANNLNTPVASEDTKSIAAKTIEVKPNDLRIIEGIGPALAKILVASGIDSFAKLSESNESALRELLSTAGSRYKVHDPSTWPAQAKLAVEEKWEELKVFQQQINNKN